MIILYMSDDKKKKNNIGRPLQGEPKDVRISMRARKKEKDLIKEKAKKRKMSLSEYFFFLAERDDLN